MSCFAPIILILEDSDEDFEITVSALRLANMRCPIVRCSNVRDVTDFLQREGSFASIPRPLLILLDLNLAGVDGRKLLKQFRQTEWLRAVPISVLTTSSNPADVELCYAEGANTYLIKPVNLERFETMISNFITFWFDTAALPTQGGETRHAGFSY